MSGYDLAESNAPWGAFQDFGHNHWHNSLIWGENIHGVAIYGPGLIWGWARGHNDPELPIAEAPGVDNKAIALKNCHNVIFRDLSMLACGHFAILATGVDNLTMDNLKIDTNRDGINIDCCRNVRISNCSVNSPWDDAICPKSSFALGYARPTENVTIADCYVTGGYQVDSLIDGSFKRFPETFEGHGWQPTGRIKCGTESNAGFRNIAIANCVFESCRGLALETVDGGIMEDITVTEGHHARHPQRAGVPAARITSARPRGHSGWHAQTRAAASASRDSRTSVRHDGGHMGATHFLTKTLPKVVAEMALSVLAYNLKRVMNIVGVKPLIAALAA